MVFFSKWRPIIEEMRAADRVRAALGSWAPSDRSSDQPEDQQRTGTPLTGQLAAIDGTAPEMILNSPYFDEKNSTQPLLRRAKSLSQIHALQRSDSVGSSSADTYSPHSMDPAMLAPSWQGCGQYFCPSPRAPGDPRPRCAPDNFVRSCNKCGVHVCQGCLNDSQFPPPCDCSACREHGFMCPNCRLQPFIRSQCVWEEEELVRVQQETARAAQEAEEREKVRVNWQAESAEREEADDMAKGVSEFMGALEELAQSGLQQQ